MIAATCPVIALLSDFGSSDWFVGVMKGVVTGICPQANLVDLCHEIQPHNIMHGAFVLSVSQAWFPRETVFLAVVDPGVGTTREGVIVRSHGQWFVGPNNGLFGFADDAQAWRLRESDWVASATFHGRDIFAPAAARLAAGQPREWLTCDEATLRPCPAPLNSAVPGEGQVLFFDHFGNAITNLRADARRALQVELPGGLSLPMATTYGDVPEGQPLAYWGSAGYLEISVHCGSARESFNLRSGDTVRLLY